MNPLITDYFAAEDAIVARLKEAVPEAKAVLTPFTANDIKELAQVTPCLHVIYAGDNVARDSAGNRIASMVDQRWLVIIAVRTAHAQLADTTEIRRLVGPLVVKVLVALQGWSPVEWMRPLGRSSGSPPAGYSSSFAYYPFVFEGRVSI